MLRRGQKPRTPYYKDWKKRIEEPDPVRMTYDDDESYMEEEGGEEEQEEMLGQDNVLNNVK